MLRDKLIEAGARAIWDEWDSLEDLEALDEDGRANAHADIEIVLDAFLDTLEANADETIHPRYNDLTQPWRLGDAAVEDLIAALRPQPSFSQENPE